MGIVHDPARLALVARPWSSCLLTGVVIGTCIGLLVARLGIPSFVVTLAAFLGLQGLLLRADRRGRHDRLSATRRILAIINNNLPVWLGWALFVVGRGRATPALTFRRSAARRKAGLTGDAAVGLGAQDRRAWWSSSALATYYLSQERSRNPAIVSLKGVPIVVAVLLVPAGRPDLRC